MAEGKPSSAAQDPALSSRGATPPIPKFAAAIIRILDHRSVGLFNNLLVGFLTFESLLAAYSARNDPWAIAFIACAATLLMLFFWCIRAYEKAPLPRKKPLSVASCLSAVFLIVLFSSRVASMVPFGFAVVAWSMAGIAILVGSCFIIFVLGMPGENGAFKP